MLHNKVLLLLKVASAIHILEVTLYYNALYYFVTSKIIYYIKLKSRLSVSLSV